MSFFRGASTQVAPLKAGKMKSCLAGVGAGASPARVLAAAVAACLTLNGLVVAWTPHAVLPLRPGTSAVLCRCAASIPCRLSRTWCRPSAPRACACACRGSHAKIILPCRPTGAGRVTGSRLAAPAAFEGACGCGLVRAGVRLIRVCAVAREQGSSQTLGGTESGKVEVFSLGAQHGGDHGRGGPRPLWAASCDGPPEAHRE